MARKKLCGRPNCRCASGWPEDLHGPHYEWNRYINGRLAHKIVSLKQAEELKRAMNNQREVKATSMNGSVNQPRSSSGPRPEKAS